MVVLETKLIVTITKDLWVNLLSVQGEDVGSMIFMVFSFRIVGTPYPELLFKVTSGIKGKQKNSDFPDDTG